MLYNEDDLFPISALQHLLFCERRCALIHIEGLWDENVATAEGSILHEHSHEPGSETRGDLRIARGLRLRSLKLGLTGIADVVEFRRLLPGAQVNGVHLGGVDGLWQPSIVEYKRGRLRHEEGYEIQLCAQTLCLEEMLRVQMDSGTLFYGKTRRRLDVVFTEDLRSRTEIAAARLHELIDGGVTPKAVREPKCDHCSLIDLCLPAAMLPRRSVRSYLARAIAEAGENTL